VNDITEYYTLAEIDPDALDHAVNKGIEDGYEPFGQPYLNAADPTHVLYHQAMVRRGRREEELVPDGAVAD
jgi:hypothetical protein